MKDSINFYMVTISPWVYLSLNRLKKLIDDYHLKLNIKPIDIFDIFKTYGTKGVKDRPKPVQKNRINEINRWSNYLNIKMNTIPQNHPVNPELSSKLIIASSIYGENNEKLFELTNKLCKLVWEDNLDVSNKEIILTVASELNIKNEVLNSFEYDNKVKETYLQNTAEAKNKDVFGVPTFIYKDELFFGQDRIFMLEKILQNK